MRNPETKYIFTPSERGIFAEVYFPKKVVHQPAIFTALRNGHSEAIVKKYLKDHVEALLDELREYKQLFNPHQYDSGPRRPTQPTVAGARQRIDMYASPFRGWSMYEVDGVWEAKRPRGAEEPPAEQAGEERRPDVVEERTQIIRIIFRLPSRSEGEARTAGCFDVLRAVIFWTMGTQGSLDEHRSWSTAEQRRFLAHHAPWPKKKLAFAKQFFSPVAKEVEKWIDDCALFTSGYLVRSFADSVLAEKKLEEELWVTSFFTLGVNVIKPVGPTVPSKSC